MAESFNYAELFNYIEIVLWSLFGFVLLVKSRDSKPDQTHIFYISSIAFFLFAISDYIEIQTGGMVETMVVICIESRMCNRFPVLYFQIFKNEIKWLKPFAFYPGNAPEPVPLSAPVFSTGFSLHVQFRVVSFQKGKGRL